MGFEWTKRPAVFSGPKDKTNSRARRRYLRIGAIALGVVVLILLLIPLFINVNSFRPKVESEASDAFGRKVTLGNLSLSLFSGSVGADNIAIAGDPVFSSSPFVTAKSLKMGVELMPLIFHRQLNVTYVTLEEPQITLLKAANGKWNFSSIGGTSKKESQTNAAKPTFSIAKLNVNDGRLTVGKVNSSAKPEVYDNVMIAVTDFSFTSQFPFKLTADLPGGGDVNLTGRAGAIAEDASRTPVDAAVKINNLNFAGLKMIAPASGIAGVVNFDGTLKSNGSQATAVGVMTGRQMKFAPRGTPAPMTITVKHAVDVDLDKQMGTIRQGDVSIGSAQAHLTGTFQLQDDTEVVNLRLNAPGMPVNEIEAALPAAGVELPSGSKLRGGTLSAELGIVGPLDKLVVTGPVRISNTELANFNLGEKLGALASFAGKAVSSPNTSIQNASLDARRSPEGLQASNINLTVPAIGVITGAGTVSPAGALSFKMLANLHGGAVGGGLTKLETATGKSGIPFAIEGTASNPKFVPEIGGVAAGLAKNGISNLTKGNVPGAGSVTKGLGGLLGHKKQ